jgi:putative ABC transport system substrate-binding protein
MIRRRDLITLLGGAAAAWPVTARAQQPREIRRIAVLLEFSASDREASTYLSGFTSELRRLGWIDGSNARIDVRWAGGNVEQMQILATELVALQPDVIFGNTTPVTAALQRATRTIPIVFATVADPIGSGFVASLPHPGANLTGFSNMEGTMAGKCVELLKEVAPRTERAAMMFNPDTTAGGGAYFLSSFEEAARALNVEPIIASVRSVAEIETVIASLGHGSRGGIVALPDGFMMVHRAEIVSRASDHNVPTVGALPSAFVRDGGLLSYGSDIGDMIRRAAPYVDRILKGEKPADMPVQLPIKFNMAINLKTAKALGLSVPPTLLALADEVIE